MQLINPASSRSIPAQGGSADLLVQLNWTSPSPRRPRNSSNSTAAQEPREGSSRTGGSGGIRPAVEWVYLNGLQCTRLPLARSSTSRQAAAAAAEGEDGSLWSFEDCGTSEWALDANGTLAGLDFGLDSWANSSAGGDRGASALGEPGVTEVLAALRQLSCMSQLCCGLQVMPGSVVTISNSSSGAGNSTEPVVLAADGPGPDWSMTGGNTSQVRDGWGLTGASLGSGYAQQLFLALSAKVGTYTAQPAAICPTDTCLVGSALHTSTIMLVLYSRSAHTATPALL